jgi:hypothetical protein
MENMINIEFTANKYIDIAIYLNYSPLNSGKSELALAGTEYRLVPYHIRLVKRENRLVFQEDRLVT